MLSSQDMNKCIGQIVEITFKKNNNKIKGEIYTVIPDKNILVLLTKKSISDDPNPLAIIINTKEIASITLSKETLKIDNENIIKVDIDKILDNEKRNLSKDILIKKAETEPYFRKGLNVYEELSKFYKCSYDGKRIVLDEIDAYIEEPFRLKNLHCEDEDTQKFLSKMVAAALKNKK